MEDKTSSKLRIINIILAIIAPVLLIIITASVIHAWYTNVIQTGSIDATTQNVSIEYKINNGNNNVLNYEISNLTFFDSTANEEAKYLDTMAFRIDLSIKNNSKTAVSYKVVFESQKTIVSDNNNTQISRSYAACIYDNVTTSETLTNVESFLDRDSATNNGTLFSSEKSSLADLAVGSSSTVTLFVFGIQDIPLASSDDFLYTSNRADTRTYNFKLTIIAEPQGEATVEENS